MLTASVSIRVPSPAQKEEVKLPFSFMCYYVYILYSESTDTYYKGQTENLEERVHRHNKGYEKSTKRGLSWTLVWSTGKADRSTAVRLEQKLKNLSRRKLEEFIQKNSGQDAGPDVTREA